MKLKRKDLESTMIKNYRGFNTRVRPGNNLYLVNPKDIFDKDKRKSIQAKNDALIERIGPPPYVLKRITEFPHLITFEVEGKEGTRKGLSKHYFIVY